MSVIHVQFADETETVVMTVYGCVQGPEIPNQGEIDEEDPRYLSFLESRLPSAKDSAESSLLEKLRYAELNIAPLRYADELGESNDEDQVQLLAWKKYSVALIRVRTQAGFPQIIEWPVAPA